MSKDFNLNFKPKSYFQDLTLETKLRSKIKGQIRGKMVSEIDHYVDQDLSSMYQRLNNYSSAAAADSEAAHDIRTGLEVFRRFFSRFLQSYFGKKGYREGYMGIALAMFSAMYPVLAYVKAKEILGGKSDREL